MSGGESMAGAIEPQVHRDRLARHQFGHPVVPARCARLRTPARHEQGFALGRDVAQSRDHHRPGTVGAHAQAQPWEAQDLERLAQPAESKQSENASSGRWSSGWLGPP